MMKTMRRQGNGNLDEQRPLIRCRLHNGFAQHPAYTVSNVCKERKRCGHVRALDSSNYSIDTRSPPNNWGIELGSSKQPPNLFSLKQYVLPSSKCFFTSHFSNVMNVHLILYNLRCNFLLHITSQMREDVSPPRYRILTSQLLIISHYNILFVYYKDSLVIFNQETDQCCDSRR